MTTEELSTKVDELTQMYKEAMEELKALKESTNPTQVSSSVPATTNGAKQIVVFPRDKKIKNFTGKKTEGDQPVEDFIEELKTTGTRNDPTRESGLHNVSPGWTSKRRGTNVQRKGAK